MNEDFELRQRIQNADPGKDAPALNEGIVSQAALKGPKRLTSFRTARFAMAGASLSIVALAVSSLSIFQPASNEPLFALAGSAQGGAMSQDATSAEAGKIASDSSMMIWPGYVPYNYIAGDISSAEGKGVVYQAEVVGEPLDFVAKLAQIFGLDGAPTRDEWSTPEYPSYSLQNETSSVGFMFSGSGNWYYSSWDSSEYACESSVREGEMVDSESGDSGEASESIECPTYQEPVITATDAELIAEAAELFGSLGFSVDQSAARIYRGWGASVSFANIQQGIDTGLDFMVSWGHEQKITYVAGHSFKLTPRGEFATVSAIDAVARISDGRWFGAAPNSLYEAMAATGIARDVTSEPSDGIDSEMDAEVVPEEPKTQDLLITRADESLLSVYDQSGTLWMVPGYILYNDLGWFDSIISLEEGVIELPEPYDFEIMPYIEEAPQD
jgi:hypothetical protein